MSTATTVTTGRRPDGAHSLIHPHISYNITREERESRRLYSLDVRNRRTATALPTHKQTTAPRTVLYLQRGARGNFHRPNRPLPPPKAKPHDGEAVEGWKEEAHTTYCTVLSEREGRRCTPSTCGRHDKPPDGGRTKHTLDVGPSRQTARRRPDGHTPTLTTLAQLTNQPDTHLS